VIHEVDSAKGMTVVFASAFAPMVYESGHDDVDMCYECTAYLNIH
jgi:hypothetical protein